MWRAAGEVVAVARPLQLAAAEALAGYRALMFGNGALDLQELIVGIVRDRVLWERDLAGPVPVGLAT